MESPFQLISHFHRPALGWKRKGATSTRNCATYFRLPFHFLIFYQKGGVL